MYSLNSFDIWSKGDCEHHGIEVYDGVLSFHIVAKKDKEHCIAINNPINGINDDYINIITLYQKNFF